MRRLFGTSRSGSLAADVVVVGGGIVGLSIARELAERQPTKRIMLLEKEDQTALHGSGRNSGVLHAGFYYDEGSLKAQLCREGNQYMRWLCMHKGLPLNECGKLVVAQTPEHLPGLEHLYHRGKRNGINVEMVSEDRARDLEPLAVTHGAALWSPTTAAADCAAVTRAVADDATDLGVDIRLSTRLHRVDKTSVGGVIAHVTTPEGSCKIEASHLVNAAGLYADKVAHSLGFGEGYALIPLKGIYLYCDIPLQRLLYPVPDLTKNVLGVHYTITVDGSVKIGPTAMPAFWRENYQGLDNFSASEMWEVLQIELGLLASNQFGFRKQVVSELRKYWRPYMIGSATQLVRGATNDDFTTFGKAGIRAQLVDLSKRKLVMDFLVQGDTRSTHVLNAVSPAWTCSYPFAKHICDKLPPL